ncbi:MAG TPA: cytochrome c oxidase subunit 3 [Methylomirabilota bacterium]|nr:cytochrome c oxidase subunit 3 [Methylomirabilota bacterium]
MEIPYTVEARNDTGLYNAKVGIWLFLASEVMLFGALFSSYILLRVGADPGTWPHGLLNIPIGTFNTAVLITSSVTVVLSWAALQMRNFAKYRKFQAITIACALGFLGIKTFEYREKFGHYEVWLKNPITVKHGDKEVQTDRLLGHIEFQGTHPSFWSTATLAAKQVESFKFEPDPFHYTMTAREMAHAKKAAAGKPHEVIEIKSADVKRLSAFVPAHSTYFGIYFTLTALHALHVLGGALVIAYLWGPGAKMWKTEPERYINRVEVSGLFWHFVDLVWIFLFPVLYLL